jgi:hypothetical protein
VRGKAGFQSLRDLLDFEDAGLLGKVARFAYIDGERGPKRAYLPREELRSLASYDVLAPLAFEEADGRLDFHLKA